MDDRESCHCNERTSRLLLAAMAWAGAGALFLGMRRKKRRIDFLGLSVVISGGSRGLGLEIARQLGREGARISILARDRDELERAAVKLAKVGADVMTYPCDIRDRQKVDQTVAEIMKARGCVDVLINVAGVIQVAPFENLELQDFQDSVDIHAWGPYHLIRAIVPQMQRRRSGRIVNISSIGGAVAVPHLLAYSMGKFALTGLSDGFRAELARYNVHVTTVIPGLMRTGSPIHAFFRGQHRKEYAWFSLAAANPMLSTSARRAARKIIEACRYGDPRLIITVPAQLFYVANSLFPGVTAFGTGLAARLLPGPAKASENALHTGKESGSPLSPSVLTKLNDKVVRDNNED